MPFFKKAIGMSPIEYLNEYRIRQAVRLLKDSSLPVTEICLDCGYNNMGIFSENFANIQEPHLCNIGNTARGLRILPYKAYTLAPHVRNDFPNNLWSKFRIFNQIKGSIFFFMYV
ncbi:MAG: helix-turn-helix transcriptional regulator [Ruminococcus sp.]